MSAHLTQEQFSDVLLGVTRRETTEHLDACPHCRAEIETMHRTLASFRTASVRWSEGAAKPGLPGEHRMRSRWARPTWALATAAAVLAVVIPFALWRGSSRDAVATIDAQEQIAFDNQLLANIQAELEKTVPVPLQPLQ